jgi:hypothetical protein
VLLVGDDANDQNLQQKGAPFYIASTAAKAAIHRVWLFCQSE